jgi:GT2 family glycosyltransferase
MSSTPHVALVVLNYNGLDDTLKCLMSLRELSYPNLTTILVDNGSAVDPMEASLRIMPDLVTVRTGKNLGYAGGNNRGMEVALERGAEFVLVLNNDTTVAPNIVTALVDAFASDDHLGVVGPVINYMDEPATVMTDGVEFNARPHTEFFGRIPVEPSDRAPSLVPVDIVNGCCMMFRASALRKAGLFDESLFIVHEESDLCLRIARQGYRCAVLGQSLVWHKGSASFDRSGRKLQRYFDTRNLFILLRRHAGHVGSSRPFSASVWPYLRYAAYRYEIEVEAGKDPAARGVAEGLRDALCGVTGPYVDRPRSGLGALLTVMRVLHRCSTATRSLRTESDKAA